MSALGHKRILELAREMSALCQKRTHAVQHETNESPRRCVGIVPYRRPATRCPPIALGEHFHQAPPRRYGTLSRPSTLRFWHPCDGDDVMDRNNRIGRRERLEILKILQGLGEGVVAINKGQLRPLRPNTILGALEESIARRNREGRIWSAFLDQFWIGRLVDDPRPSRSPKMRHDGSRRT